MEETSVLPVAVSESTIEIGSIILRVYQLDDGRRVIAKDDVEALFASWATEGGDQDG